MPTWKTSPPKPNRSNCRAERHLWTYGLSLAIYTRIGSLTYGGKNLFYGKIKNLASYFGANEESTRRAFNRLINGGWLERTSERNKFKYVEHDDRAFLKEDCRDLPDLPSWELEADPFVGKIHAAFGGEIRVKPNWIGAARQHATEEEFLADCRIEVRDGSGTAGTRFWNVVRRFRKKARTDLVEKAALK